jgi:hypothetical protein
MKEIMQMKTVNTIVMRHHGYVLEQMNVIFQLIKARNMHTEPLAIINVNIDHGVVLYAYTTSK